MLRSVITLESSCFDAFLYCSMIFLGLIISMGVVVNAVTVYTSYLLGKYMIEEEQQGYEIDVKLCAFTASEMKEAQKKYNSFEGISDEI